MTLEAVPGAEHQSVRPYPSVAPVVLPRLVLPDLVSLEAAVRESATGASSLEQAAQGVVDVLRASLLDEDGHEALDLLRVFATATASELPPDLRVLVESSDDEEPCLALMATTGALPEWNDRHLSSGHRVVRLGPSAGAGLSKLPMVQGLFAQFGVSSDDLSGSGQLAFNDFGVFHVEEALGSPLVPAQDFVVQRGIRSVLGFGCGLADGRVVAVLMFSRVTIPAHVADLFRTLAVGLQVALIPLSGRDLFVGGNGPLGPPPAPLVHAASRRAFEHLVAVLGAEVRKQSVQLHEEIEVVDQLRRLGTDLATELDLERLVDAVVAAAVRTTGARFGAFFYNQVDEAGQSYVLYSIAGVSPENFDGFPMPGPTDVFAPTFAGEGVVRSDDITADPRYGRNTYGGMPPGHLPVRSYLAAPVVSRDGEVLGGLFLAHPAVGVFDERAEALLTGIAGHAAIGIDNARLFASHRDTAVELQRSLLPGELLPQPGLRFDACYEPGATQGAGAVGGDWYDVVPLDGGRTAVVIGDVMGRGVRAAATMGQLRTALRTLLLSGHPADEALHHLNRLVEGLPAEQIATCMLGIYDPVAQRVCLTSAGHLPALLRRPGCEAQVVDLDPGGPLGALGGQLRVTSIDFPSGSSLLLFTDGLVERRGEDIDTGLARLIEHYPEPGQLSPLIDRMRQTTEVDDTAVLLIVAD